MDMLNPAQNNLDQARFSLEQAKIRSLTQRFKNHENEKELMDTARRFEGVFIQQLLNEMDKTIERSGFLSGGSAEDTFRGLLYQNVADMIATRQGGSGFGLAEAIYKQLEQRLPQEELQNNTNGGEKSTRRINP